ncbi:protocadherin gamma-B7-like, partial [Vombatus ursinus]|uniref:protocadherin gamma-B7-like n=1 Tax=Vombatus ursinus TaxID=29139 RepID=UPI000FFCF2D3
MGRKAVPRGQVLRWQVLYPFFASLFCRVLSEHISYSIPEEMEKGSVVGNLAKDLGLDVRDLPARKLRVNGKKQHFAVSIQSGELLVSDRIDREHLCGQKSVCTLTLETVAENPLNVFHVIMVIQDINDNPPHFPQNIINLQINELALKGSRFGLESAVDPDVGVNSLQSYQLSPNEHFSMVVKESPDGRKYPELVMEKPLDREKQSSHHLVLVAVDGGNPVLSGTAQIKINVTDANDNPPVFSQDFYKVSLPESLPPGSSVLRVMATDKDEGINAEITYFFKTTADNALNIFYLDHKNGEIRTQGHLDFEDTENYILSVGARDGGGMAAECKVILKILDENDNQPEVTFTSVSSTIAEDAVQGTVIALFKIEDLDSGVNGEVTCHVEENAPFRLESSSRNYYKLLTDGPLDREQTPQYNITVTASDKGKPPLST